MLKIPVAVWIANAAACLCGTYGKVTAQAQTADCSRQTLYDHARKVQAAIEAEHAGGPTHAELSQENQRLRQENAQLWDWLEQTVDFPTERRRQFTVTAAAMGLSLSQIQTLLAIVLGERAVPGRATLGRIVQAAGAAAGRVLQRLDARCRELILVGGLDEIFCGQAPVLMGVEPSSQVWFLGQLSPDRQGATWQAALQEWSALEYVVADAGSGLQAGIAAEQQRRVEQGEPPLQSVLDLFHTAREATRVLGHRWRSLEGLWHRAEKADAAVAAEKQQGRPAQRAAAAARRAWRDVATAFAAYEAQEAAWRRIQRALSLWREDGTPGDRAHAEAEIAAALPALSGRCWAKLRRYLAHPACLTFLDRLHEQLEQAEPDATWRSELVRLWWLRHERRGGPAAAALVQRLVCQGLSAEWVGSYRRVACVLRAVVRASSAVEGLNSILRMHQARHRGLSQGLLDLKRLYWNCHRFREGRRRRRSPYELLGVLPAGTAFWTLLDEELSAAEPAERRAAA
jgi:hypothetical protein